MGRLGPLEGSVESADEVAAMVQPKVPAVAHNRATPKSLAEEEVRQCPE
jgi:hypothetical protein